MSAGASAGTRPSAFLYAFAAMSMFSLEAAFARAIGPGIDLAQVGVIRSLVQFLCLWVWLGRAFGGSFATARPGMHATRGFFSVTGLAAYFYVFANLPMTIATVLVFSGVLVTTVAAQTVLREEVGWRRWAATAVGFIGVLIVVRPGAAPFDLALAAGIYLAINGAAINIATKGLTRTEPTATIMAWVALTTIVVALPAMALTSVMPSARDFALMVGIGVSGTIGQFAVISAYRQADLSAVAPVMYMRIVIAAAIGYLVFSERLDAATIVGAIIVTVSALYITMREAKLARQREPI